MRQIIIGQSINTDGDLPAARGGSLGESIMGSFHGRTYEQAIRRNVFTAYFNAASITAYTATVQKSIIWNGTFNTNLVILGVYFGASGTPGTSAGVGLTGNSNQFTIPGTLTAVTASGSGLIGVGTSGATPYNVATVTTAGGFYFPLFSLETGATTKFPTSSGYIDIGGAVICPPYGWVGVASSVASTTNCQIGIVYEEVAV